MNLLEIKDVLFMHIELDIHFFLRTSEDSGLGDFDKRISYKIFISLYTYLVIFQEYILHD